MEVLDIIRSSNGSGSTDGLSYDQLKCHAENSSWFASTGILCSSLFYLAGDALMKDAEGFGYDLYSNYGYQKDVVVNPAEFSLGQSSIIGSVVILSLALGAAGYSLYRHEQAKKLVPPEPNLVEVRDNGVYVHLISDTEAYRPDFSSAEVFSQKINGAISADIEKTQKHPQTVSSIKSYDPAKLADEMHAQQMKKLGR